MRRYQKAGTGVSKARALSGVLPMFLFSFVFISIIACTVNAADSTRVFAKPPSISLVSNPDPSLYGQQVSFTATLAAGVPNGETITFKDGSTSIGTCTISSSSCTLKMSSLSAGSHSIVASYPGDANFAPGTSVSILQTIRPAITSTALTSNANPAYGQPVAFTATVTSAGGSIPNGEAVSFRDGSTIIGTGVLSSGTATFSTTFLLSGQHPMSAVYSGDANFSSSTSNTLTETVIKSASSLPSTAIPNTTTISGQPPCFLGLNVSSGAQYYVAPQKIIIYYTVKKVGSCALPPAAGTLSLSSSATGVIYASIPINISSVISTPVTRVASVNSSDAPKGANLAVLLLSAGSTSNLSSTSFYVLQPANITIQSLNIIPNTTQIGAPLSIVTDIFNNAFFDATNATMNLKIVYPNLSVYRTKQYIGRIPAFQNTTIAINPGIVGVPELQGKYILLENVSFYSNYSTLGHIYTSNSLYSNTSTATYTAYLNPNAGYSPFSGYPTPPASIGKVRILSFPYYTDALAVNGSYSNLSFVFYNSGNYPVTVNMSLPNLQVGKLTLSAGALAMSPNQSGTAQLQFTSSGNTVGVYIVPINISITSPSNATKAQVYMIMSLNGKAPVPQVLSNIKLLNGTKNASVQLNIINPTNTTNYKLSLSTSINSSAIASKRNVAPYGQGANLSVSNNNYMMHWTISQLGSNGLAQVGYNIANVLQPRSLLIPSTLLSSTKQSNISSFTIIGISKPQSVYPNTTVNITISAIYTGTNVTTLAIGLIPPPGANVINQQENFKAIPNSAIDAKFAVSIGAYTSNQLSFKLIIPGQFAPQTKFITLNVAQRPVVVYSLSDYLSDPRTIFGLLTLGVYLLNLAYGKFSRMSKNRKLKKATSEIKNAEKLRTLPKRIGEAIISDGTKRTFRRHLNKDESLAGFVEDNAIVGKDVIIAPTAIIEGEPIISGNARILGKATVSGHAIVRSNVQVSGNAKVGDNAEVYGNAKIFGDARVFGECEVYDSASVSDNAEVFGDARVYGEAQISGKAKIYGSAQVSGDAKIKKLNVFRGDIVSGTH